VLLADQLFFLAYSDRTGRSRLHPRATGLGLAAGLLAELMLARRIAVFDGGVHVVSREPPGDALTHDVLDLLLTQGRHRDLRTWLAFLGQDAADRVGGRLARADALTEVRRRGLRRTQTVYLPSSDERRRNAAAWEPVRLAEVLLHRRAMTESDAVLTGLMAATGLTRHVLWDPERHRPAVAWIATVVDSLPDDLHELVTATEAAVGAAVAAGRR